MDIPRRCPTCLRRLGQVAPSGTPNLLDGDGCADCVDDGTACPFCSKPDEWSACPIHTDGQDED